MNPDYRNVICPWQTPKEIYLAEKSVRSLMKKFSREEQIRLLRLDVPDRVWYPKGDGRPFDSSEAL